MPEVGFRALAGVGRGARGHVGTWAFHDWQMLPDEVPHALGVRRLDYQLEKSWRVEAGGPKAGIRFYRLPAAVANSVEEGGVAHLERIAPKTRQTSRDGRGRYGAWSETPIHGDHWTVDPSTGLLDVTHHLCAGGLCLDIPPDRLSEANEIISKPGSFYARCPIGIIVVSPARRRVLYFYNG